MAGAFAALSIVGFVAVLLDGSVWYLSVPGFTLTFVAVAYVYRNLGQRLTVGICLILLALWLAACMRWFLLGEIALAAGLLVVGSFISAVNGLRFCSTTIRDRCLRWFPLVGFGLGFCGVFGYWLTSPEVARWFPSTLDLMLMALVPSSVAGAVGLGLGFAVKLFLLPQRGTESGWRWRLNQP